MNPDMMIKMIFVIVVVSLILLIVGIFRDAYQQKVIDQNQRRAEDIRAKYNKDIDEDLEELKKQPMGNRDAISRLENKRIKNV